MVPGASASPLEPPQPINSRGQNQSVSRGEPHPARVSSAIENMVFGEGENHVTTIPLKTQHLTVLALNPMRSYSPRLWSQASCPRPRGVRMVSPVSGLRSRGSGVAPSGEAGDEASGDPLSRRGGERDSESYAYGERACDVAVGALACVVSFRACECVHHPHAAVYPPPPPANLVDLPFKVRSLPFKPPRSGEPPRSERLLW